MAQWDWAPVAQGLNGLMMNFAMQRQYQNLLKTLGTGMPPGGAGPFGGPSSAPPQPFPTARTEDDNGMPIPGAPAPIQQAQGMTTGFMPRGPGRPGEWDWMEPQSRGPLGLGILPAIFGQRSGADSARPPGAGQGIIPERPSQGGMIDPRMMEMFRKLPPQIGMPLLMQTMQQQMGGGTPHKLEQYDPEKDVVDPYTGQIVRKGTPKPTASTRKYDTINGVPGWIDENGFTPDPNAPKKADEAPSKTISQQNAEALGLQPGTKEYNDYIRADTLPAPGGGEGAETWANPVTEAGPDGKPIQVRYGNRGGRRVVEGASPAQSASGQPTVDQARANQLYTRAKEQLPIVLENFDALGTVRSAMAENLYGGAAFASTEFQRADGALKDIAASYLYSVSGATATPSEIEGTVDRVRPKVTDSAATKADKKKRIRDMVESIKLRSSNPVAVQAPSAPPPQQTGLPQGWSVKVK
jgi:hypothetical protein